MRLNTSNDIKREGTDGDVEGAGTGAAAGLLALGVAVAVVTWSLAQPLLMDVLPDAGSPPARGPAPVTLDQALVAACAGTLLLCVAWLLLGLTLAVAAVLAHALRPGTRRAATLLRLSERGVP